MKNQNKKRLSPQGVGPYIIVDFTRRGKGAKIIPFGNNIENSKIITCSFENLSPLE